MSKLDGITILLTAAGCPGAPGIIKSLRHNGERDIRILGTDMSLERASLHLLDGFFQVSPGDSAPFVDEVLGIASSESVDVVIPCSTMELEPLSNAASRFAEHGIRVAVSSPETLKIANNKARLYEELLQRGMGEIVPLFEKVSSAEDLACAAEKLGYPKSKICVKPSFGKGSRGFRILCGRADRFTHYINEKPDSATITLPELLSIVDGHSLPEFLVMEYLPGDEWSVDVLAKDGEMVVAVPRRRNVVYRGIAVDSTVKPNELLTGFAGQIIGSLNLSYCINMQFRYSTEGSPKLLEVNPRVSGTIVAATAAGVNLPYLCVKLCLGEAFEAPVPKWETRLLRYWEDIAVDEKGQRITY